MSEILGVLAAILSSGLGGASIAATRYVRNAIDPLAIGAFRFGIGFLFLLPIVILQRQRWPTHGDRIGAFGLGLLFFAVFPLLFNASLLYTTAARGALALSTLPLLTMIFGAVLGVEPLTGRKVSGVFVATSGVAVALAFGQQAAPPEAWRGDLLMVAAALCMALYSLWSKPFIRRSGPISFTTFSMGVGALCLIAISYLRDGFKPVAAFSTPQWLALLYLGIFGGALTFYLWAFALSRTTPTRVAISVAVNPLSAAIVGALLLDEAVGWNIVTGLVAVFTGIWIATAAKKSVSLSQHKS